MKKKILESNTILKTSLNVHDKKIFQRKKLENALKQALSWQNKIDNEPVQINNHTYFGPHKWIVCLLGSDTYDISNFISDHEK